MIETIIFNTFSIFILCLSLKLEVGFRIQDSRFKKVGFKIQDSGFRIQDSRKLDSGFKIQESWIQDSSFKIQDSGFRIQESWIQDSGFRFLRPVIELLLREVINLEIDLLRLRLSLYSFLAVSLSIKPTSDALMI